MVLCIIFYRPLLSFSKEETKVEIDEDLKRRENTIIALLTIPDKNIYSKILINIIILIY